MKNDDPVHGLGKNNKSKIESPSIIESETALLFFLCVREDGRKGGGPDQPFQSCEQHEWKTMRSLGVLCRVSGINSVLLSEF